MHARTPMQRLIGVVVAMAGVLLIGWQATRGTPPSSDPKPPPRLEQALSTEPEPPAPQAADASQPVLAEPPALVPAVNASPPPATASKAQPPASTRSAPGRRRSRAAAATPTPPSSTSPCAQATTQLQGLELDYRSGSATLHGSSSRRLADVVTHLKKCPSTLLEIRAYANESADSGENLMVSRQRAQAVVGHLARAGVAAHRLVATYRGDRPPGGNRSVLTFHTGEHP